MYLIIKNSPIGLYCSLIQSFNLSDGKFHFSCCDGMEFEFRCDYLFSEKTFKFHLESSCFEFSFSDCVSSSDFEEFYEF